MIEKLLKMENDLVEAGFTPKQAEALLKCMIGIQKEFSVSGVMSEYFYNQIITKRDENSF